MPTYHIENFGCRATQADGYALALQFEAEGLNAASDVEADIVVLNTCTVTAAADQDARAAVRRLQRQNPLAKIIVTGCYAQRAPAEVASLPGVAAVIGNSHKHQLADLALRPRASSSGFLPLAALTQNSIFVSDIFAHTELQAAPVFEAGRRGEDRTRPNLKVQDGCDNRCSFCIIPAVRGQSRSLPMEEVIRQMNGLVDAGYREVVISGINLGRWGRDLQRGPSDFESLLRTILEETKLEKLRISSVEPMDWSDPVITLLSSSPRIAKHAHVPLQSGSDAVLRRMHRKYRPWHYRARIEKIHSAIPDAAIGADVMVGFPGETEAEFEETRRLIEELPFTYLHVFTYSARPGTPAAALPDAVPTDIARDRNKVLRDMALEKKRLFMQSFVGRKIEAITLSDVRSTNESEFTEALSDNYLKVRLRGRQQANRWHSVQIQNLTGDFLLGTAV